MTDGLFTDAGYRFRRNTFDRLDYWYPFIESTEQTFWDVKVFNSDTFLTGDETQPIAEIYFRLDIDEVLHSR